MPVRNINFGPLQEVPSIFLDGLQEWILEQRGTGPANTAPAGMDGQTNATARKIVVELDTGVLIPPGSGIIDLYDWRDRIIYFELGFHRTVDIRSISVGRSVTPEYTYTGSIYCPYTGLASIDLESGGSVGTDHSLGLYVALADGRLGLKKNTGFVSGTIRCTPPLKVP